MIIDITREREGGRGREGEGGREGGRERELDFCTYASYTYIMQQSTVSLSNNMMVKEH